MSSARENTIDLILDDPEDDSSDLPDIEADAWPVFENDSSQASSVVSSYYSNFSSSSSVDVNSNLGKDFTGMGRGSIDKEQRKRQKEEERLGKLLLREQKAREREEKKRTKEAEKTEKANARVLVKSKRPGECMKYITVLLEQSLLQTGVGAKLLPLLHDSEIGYRFENFALDKLVCWQRETPSDNQSTAGDEPEEEPQVLLILPVSDFVQYIYASAKKTDEITLSLYVTQLQDNLPNKELTIAVQGMEKYFRDVKTLSQRQYRQNVETAAGCVDAANKGSKKLGVDAVISRLELEQALVVMELENTVNFKFVETDEEMAKLVLMMTKAVAETPFKRSRNEVDFAFLPDNKNVVRVGKNGDGLIKLWSNQFLQFHNVSPDMAKAITAEFPSPKLLMEAYENAPSKRDAELLLADIRVRRGAGVLETSRRIGKELSRRIFEFMTSDDPNHILK